MTGDRWVLLVVRGDTGCARRFFLSRRVRRAARPIVIALLVTLLFTGAIVAAEWLHRSRIHAEHTALVAELHAVQDRIERLEGRISRIVNRGDGLRMVAGLNPLDRELLEVGVGGPSLPRPEEHPLSRMAVELGEIVFASRYDLHALDRRVRLLSESLTEVADSLRVQHERLLSTPSILPAQGRVTSSFAGARIHPIHEHPLPHTGIDIAAPRGTPIRAAARGEVVRLGRRGGYGLMVELDHGFGYQTLYGHLARIYVEEGDRVERGELLGSVGSTGTATAPHLHYEVRFEGRLRNPMNYVRPEAAPWHPF